MTREERAKAIKVLDDMKVKIDIPKAAKTQNDRNWALDMAIQALSQESQCTEHPCLGTLCRYYKEPCEDEISRKDIEECEELMTDVNGDIVYAVRMSDIRRLHYSVTQKSNMGCEGCIYEKTGNNSTYPCSHCSRCYTDKYKAERSSKE